jgi:polar amino acid transport system substrate-binding protein
VVAALAVAAVGCGGTSTSSTTASTTSTLPKATQDPAAAGQVPAAIRTKGVLTVAMDASYAPDEFVEPDGKTITGMDADLGTAIGQVLGLRVDLVNATFNTIIPGLQSSKFDLGLSSFTDTKDREKQLDFVTYFTSSEAFYVSANSKASFDGLASLCGHTVAVESGTTEADDATAQVKACQDAGKPADNVLVFQDQTAGNLAVSTGRAEVGFSDSQVAKYQVDQHPSQFKLTGKPFNPAPYGIAMPKNGLAPPVLAAVNDLLREGIYLKILTRWGIQDGAITTPVINGATS